MELLRDLLKISIYNDKTTYQQLTGSNKLEVVRHRATYPWLIILLGSLLIVILWLFIWQQTNYEHDKAMEETSRETMNLTIAFEEHVRRVVSDIDKDLLKLKQAYEGEGITSLVISSYMEGDWTDPARNQISIANEQGILAASFNKIIFLVNISEREHFQIHRSNAKEGLYIGKPIKTIVSGQTAIPLTRRINKPDGSFAGIVSVGLKPEYFTSFYKKIDIGQDQLISLVGMDWVVRARQSGDNLEVGQNVYGSPLWKDIQSGRTYGTYITNNVIDGKRRVFSYRIMPDYPLLLVVGKNIQVALAEFEKRKQGYFIGGLMISLFIMSFCRLLVRLAKKQHLHNIELEERIKERTQELRVQNEELLLARTKLETSWNSINTGVVIIDSQGENVWMNDAALKIHEFKSRESLMTKVEQYVSEWELYNPNGLLLSVEQWPVFRALRGDFLQNYETHLHHIKSGQRKICTYSTVPIMDSMGKITLIIITTCDITESKAMEEEITKHRDNLQALVEEQVEKLNEVNTEMTAIFQSISDPFYVLDKQWCLIYVNKAVQKAGIKLSEMHIGQSIWEVLPELVGSEIYNSFHEACAANQDIHIKYNVVNDKLFDVHLYPYGKGLFVYMRDVTEQKKYEVEIARLDRFNIIGEMAASIGHEVRNPMTTVRGYLQWFGQKPAFVEYRESLDLMIEELDRGNSIITEFLSLAKNKKVDLRPTNLNTVIQNLFPLLQADAFRRGNTIKLELEDIHQIPADDKEIRQCILNLVGNGLDAMPDGGTVTIRTFKTDNQVVMTVRDQGYGIVTAVKEKLGTPFFTTKENGTGLGLPVCYRIAQRHQATIEIETGQEGTAFHFIFSIKNID